MNRSESEAGSQNKSRGRRLRLALLAVTLSMAGLPAFAKTEEAKAVEAADVPVNTFAGAFLAGRAAETDRDLQSAVTFFTKALELAPDDPAMVQALLLSNLSSGNIEAALPFAKQLRDAPDIDRVARLAIVVDAIKARQFSEARSTAMLADASELDTLIYALLRGWATLGAGDAKAAIAELDTLKGPEWFAPFVTIFTAMMSEISGDKAEALKRYDKALADERSMGAAPDAYLRAIEAQARLLNREGDKDKALALLDKGIAQAPVRPMFAQLKAAIEAGEIQKPLVADAAQGTAETLYALAMAINRRGAEEFVRRFLNLALHLAPGKDIYLYELARLDEAEELYTQSIEHFRQIPATSSLHKLAAMQAALNLSNLERDDEAKAQLRTLIAEDPSNNRAYLALGSIFARQKDFTSAATLYSDAIAANPTADNEFWNIYYYRGIAYERSGQWDKAEPDLREALKRFPDQPQVLNYLGYSFIDRGENLDEALKMVERAVELAPEDGYIVDSLGWAFYKLERYEEAVTTLERAVGLMPGDATINDHLGDAYWQVGRRIEAGFQWNHALAGDPEPELKLAIEAKIKAGGLGQGETVQGKVQPAPDAAKETTGEPAPKQGG